MQTIVARASGRSSNCTIKKYIYVTVNKRFDDSRGAIPRQKSWIPWVNRAEPLVPGKLRQWVKVEKAKYPEVQVQVEEIRTMTK